MPHPRARPGPPLFLLIVILLIAASVSAQETRQAEGTGSWGPDDDPTPANATWLLKDDRIVGYHVETTNGTRATCLHGNGTLTTPDGSSAAGACGGASDQGRITLYLETPGTRWNGTFEPEAPGAAGGATGPAVMERVLGLVAVAGLTGSGLLAFLLVRERRLTRHLARRLYERSRKGGRRRNDPPADEQVKRILVRSKN